MAILATESTSNKRGWFPVWHGDGLPNAGGMDGSDVFLLKVAQEAIFWAEERSGRNGEDDPLGSFGEFLEDHFAWETRPLDRVSVKVNVMEVM